MLASTSPQRRAILEQLGIPFDVVAPRYEERAGGDPVEHALGKARSVADEAGERPVLGVDTVVRLGDRVFGKPASAGEAEAMLEALGGRTHEVVSGLALVTPGWEETGEAVTRVDVPGADARGIWPGTWRPGEWEGRAGGYAIQGAGAALVERVEGDYLNVVGLPAAFLVRLLSERFPGTYGFG